MNVQQQVILAAFKEEGRQSLLEDCTKKMPPRPNTGCNAYGSQLPRKSTPFETPPFPVPQARILLQRLQALVSKHLIS
jgi:hypothetical protein